jgi:hypothetical protein
MKFHPNVVKSAEYIGKMIHFMGFIAPVFRKLQLP